MKKENTGENIKKLRTGHNMTQQQLADALSVSRPTIASYESGRTQPDVEMLKQIADLFHITVDGLIGKPTENHFVSIYRVGMFTGLALNIIVAARNLLIYIKNQFFWVEPGVVTEEMKKVLDIRTAISDVIYLFDIYFSPLFVVGIVVLVFCKFHFGRKIKWSSLLVTVLLIILSLVANIELAILLDPNSALASRVNYYDILRSIFWDNAKLMIVIIALMITAAICFFVKDRFLTKRD